MNYEQFKELVTYLYNESKVRDAYINSMPNDISDAFFDNTYTNSQGLCIDKLVDAVFGDLAEDVFWFLYECEGVLKYTHTEGEEDNEYNIEVEGRQYFVHDLESYFQYAKLELFKNDN